MLYDLENKKIQNSGDNWVAPNANVIGDVTLEKNTSIWFNATLRGDIENIYVGEGSNVQDGSVLHTDPVSAKDRKKCNCWSSRYAAWMYNWR